MDFAEIIALIARLHKRENDSDQKITKFFGKLKSGTATYADALHFAGRSGEKLAFLLMEKLTEQYPTGIPPDVLDGVLPQILRDECQTVLDASARVQAGINQRAKVGLSPVDVEVDEDRIAGLITHFKDDGMGEAVSMISNLTRSEVDETMKRNAEFQTNSGMEVSVSRFYDDVGLNHGTSPCQWCLDRTGDHVPYKEAYDRGMFQRHPGCRCTLEYHSEKGTKRQADWTHNVWKDSDETLKERRTYGR